MTATGEHTELKEPMKNTEENMEDQLPPLRSIKPNNNRHIVTFGIIIVLFTLYITAAAIRHSNYTVDSEMNEEKRVLRSLQEKENKRQANILEKLLEHEHICSELEIFIKEFKWNDKSRDNRQSKRSAVEKFEFKDSSNNAKNSRNNIEVKADINSDPDTNNNTIDLENLNKNFDESKKEQVKKKNTTAEPIIYLFALVFIYLLLKAASDINQHYKSMAKGDKRLRRCSLQSYAQTHKQDRRASKDKPLTAINQRHHFLEQRSQSFERPTKLKVENFYQKYDFNSYLRKNSSVEAELQGGAKYRYSGTLTGNTIERKRFFTNDILTSELNISPNRRCSVPALFAFQKQKMITTKSSDMSRRTSIVHGSNTGVNSLAGSIENMDPQFSESKRRVRMINRH